MKKCGNVLELVVDVLMILGAIITVSVGRGDVDDYGFLIVVGAYGVLRIINWTKQKKEN